MTTNETSSYVYQNLLVLGLQVGVEIERRQIYGIVEAMLIQDVATAEAIVAHKQGKGYSPVQKTLELMDENGYLKKVDNGRPFTQYMLMEVEEMKEAA
jgi:hypothetical protein